MVRSEIDDIFAAPPKKKRKALASQQQKTPTKSHHPETIQKALKKQLSRRGKKRTNADNDRFKDSRGTVPPRKTIDGYNIYKEDELGISTTGGDTPLCPFDCQCCF